ncbi:hypothetical protein CYMTET_18504 [Cymbomonas tetramitiformis]|uniref:Uncharacterized protein n=1 Tax=Cymbomonas tetramitiformis TaxID=36881 RepID=A0AAE0L664_9CHLO|nr:hypothetical protein CYMTET_18504 [Cymbomonas tetramitiformis]
MVAWNENQPMNGTNVSHVPTGVPRRTLSATRGAVTARSVAPVGTSRGTTPRSRTGSISVQPEESFFEVTTSEAGDALAEDVFNKEDLYLDKETLDALKELHFQFGIPALRQGLFNLREKPCQQMTGPQSAREANGADEIDEEESEEESEEEGSEEEVTDEEYVKEEP